MNGVIRSGSTVVFQLDATPMADDSWRLDTTTHAAKWGTHDILAHTRKLGAPWNHNTTRQAILHGKLSCLKYSVENGAPWTSWPRNLCGPVTRNTHDCMEYAQRNVLSEMIWRNLTKWLPTGLPADITVIDARRIRILVTDVENTGRWTKIYPMTCDLC